MMKAAFFCNHKSDLDRVFVKDRMETIASMTDLYPYVITSSNFDEHVSSLQDVEVVFSTWGMPVLQEQQIDRLKSLKAVFYAAGSVKAFAKPYLLRGITVVSSWAANAVPVAEFTVAQILLSCKGYFRNITERKTKKGMSNGQLFKGPGNFGETVSLIGCGMIGKKVLELLKNFQLNVIVYDPYVSAEAISSLGGEKVTLEDAFKRGYVVSNHAPNIPSTEGMIHKGLFSLMRDHATFINTGRGATVVEKDMIEILKERPSLTALLDVTYPEPPVADSELYTLPNVFLSGHIAGSLGDETVRMADYSIEEFKRFEKGEPLQYSISYEELEKMA